MAAEIPPPFSCFERRFGVSAVAYRQDPSRNPTENAGNLQKAQETGEVRNYAWTAWRARQDSNLQLQA